MKIITRAEWERIHPDYRGQGADGVRRVLERDPPPGPP
jgi:hypothetical protein